MQQTGQNESDIAAMAERGTYVLTSLHKDATRVEEAQSKLETKPTRGEMSMDVPLRAKYRGRNPW